MGSFPASRIREGDLPIAVVAGRQLDLATARGVLDQPCAEIGLRLGAGAPLIKRHDNMGPAHADLLRPYLAGSPQDLGESRLRCGDGPHLYRSGEVA